MNSYGVINQDGQLVIYDQQKHKQILRVNVFEDLVDWIKQHPGRYKFIDLDVVITSESINYL